MSSHFVWPILTLFLRCAHGYSKIGDYMPASDVLEHSQINKDLMEFNNELAGFNPNYQGAKDIYENGFGHSCKSSTTPRTLQGFAKKDLEGESFYDAFIAAGYEKEFWDDFMYNALTETGTFSGLSRKKRVTCLKKGALGLTLYYAAHELEAAIVKAKEVDTRNDAKSGHAWDEGWAFYYGAQELSGVHGPWEVAKKRDDDFPDGVKVSTNIVKEFNKGLINVRSATYDHDGAVAAMNAIYSMWSVTYIRAALKYLMRCEQQYDEGAHAEAFAYWMAADGWVASKSPAAAQAMREAVDIKKTQIADGTYCATKAKLEVAYTLLGLKCSDIGSFKDEAELQDKKASLKCTQTPACGETASIPSFGADAIAAVSGTEKDDIFCGKATTPAPTPSPSPKDDDLVCETGCWDTDDLFCHKGLTEKTCGEIYGHVEWRDDKCDCKVKPNPVDNTDAASSALDTRQSVSVAVLAALAVFLN